MNNDPWYKRTEFWFTVASVIGGIFGVKVSTNPIAQNISAGLAAAAPLVYNFGRGNVKAQAAAGAAIAAANALKIPAPIDVQ